MPESQKVTGKHPFQASSQYKKRGIRSNNNHPLALTWLVHILQTENTDFHQAVRNAG